MAHARRKFFEAKDENPEVANFVLNKISILYDIERKIKEENFICDSILKIRQDLSKPVMDELKSYLDKLLPEVLPKM